MGNDKFLKIALLYLLLTRSRNITALLNNTRTLKFKTQLTITYFTAVNHYYVANQRAIYEKKKQPKWIKIYQTR